jgi:hypothetical protein
MIPRSSKTTRNWLISAVLSPTKGRVRCAGTYAAGRSRIIPSPNCRFIRARVDAPRLCRIPSRLRLVHPRPRGRARQIPHQTSFSPGFIRASVDVPLSVKISFRYKKSI